MENVDYKEIARRHMEIMNREYNLVQTESQDIYSHSNEQKVVLHQDIRKGNESETIIIPYFFNFNNIKIPDDKLSVETFYVFPGTNNLIKLNLCIDRILLESFGEFHKNWKEHLIRTNTNDITIFWNNSEINRSTYDSPIFILLTLIDNKINQKWIPEYWENISHNNTNTNLLRIKFTNNITLILDKITKKISEDHQILITDQNEIEIDEDQDKNKILKELRMQEIKRTSLITEDKLEKAKSFEKKDYFKEKAEFQILLKEKGIGITSNYEKEQSKLIYDERYLNLPNELRKITFEEFVKSLTYEEIKSEKPLNRREGQEKMKLLLKQAIEKGSLNLNTTFYEFQDKFGEDNLFLQAMPIDREFLFNEAKLKIKKLIEEKKNKNLAQFKEMLNSKITFESIDENTNYKNVKKLIKTEAAYKLLSSKTEKKTIINEFLDEMKNLQKQHNKMFTNDSNLNVEDKKKILEAELAISEFETLLKDKISKKEMSWEEAFRKFGHDIRWKNKDLTDSKRMELFKEYMHILRENKKKEYRQLLENQIGLNQEIKWHDAQHLLQNDERFREVQPKDRENIFTEYLTYIQEKIAEEFAKFLDESDLISKDVPTDGIEFKNFVSKLNYDIRFQRMYKHPDKRDKMIKNKIKTLKFQYEKQKRLEAKINNRNRMNQRNTSQTWEKGNVIK